LPAGCWRNGKCFDKNIVLSFIETHGTPDAGAIAGSLGISRRVATFLLSKLKKEGVIANDTE